MKCNLCGKETSNKNNLCEECNKKHEEYKEKKNENINKKEDLEVMTSNDNKEKIEVLEDKPKQNKERLSLAEKIILIEIVLCICTLFVAFTSDLIGGIIGVPDFIKNIMGWLLFSFGAASLSVLFPVLPVISTLLGIFTGLKNKDVKGLISILIINIVVWIINLMIIFYSISLADFSFVF